MDFNEINISNEIKMALEDMGFESPTPIQEKVIPLILDRQDIIAQAPTGTGKTCAFGIPVINNIDLTLTTVQALILCPTRELVIQTENELKEVAKYYMGFKILSIYGGQNIDRQLAGLKKKPQIIVGTTGRVMDHLRRRTLKLHDLKSLILDEVDEMLDMGFREDIDVILESAPKIKQTVMFSATLPKEIIDISTRYQTNPIQVKAQHEKGDLPAIEQYYVVTKEAEKVNAFTTIMQENKYSLVLVFCNTKKRVDELCTYLSAEGYAADALHGDLRQQQRDKTMKKFRGGETQILIATDVAARGIDVDNIEAVFNFDIPHDEEYYVHRIGRTARAKRTGTAYTFLPEKMMYAIRNFERFTKSTITKLEITKPQKEQTIDKTFFAKIIKSMKRNDLTAFKQFLSEEIVTLNENHKEFEMLDIAAALLMQVSAKEAAKVFSEPEKKTARDSKSPISRTPFNGNKRSAKGGVKFFLNIGTRDNCDEYTVKEFIAKKTDIAPEDILEVHCLESFSFATVKEGNQTEMENLNGEKCNGRFLAVEVASDKPKKPAGEKPDPNSRGQHKTSPYDKKSKKSAPPKKPEKFYNKTAQSGQKKGKKK